VEVGHGTGEGKRLDGVAGMSMPAEPSGRPARMLVRCPQCTSRLMTPVDAVGGAGEDVVIERQCPECGHHDRVVTTPLAAIVWARHEARIAGSLLALADALAEGAPIELSELSVT
jgi:Zn ribbon nucleic-acid-binding protein